MLAPQRTTLARTARLLLMAAVVAAGSNGGVRAAEGVCDDGGLALTSALYSQGYEAYKDAECIPENAFTGWDRDSRCQEVTLTGLDKLKYIDFAAFSACKKKISITGAYPKMTDVRINAFWYAGTSDSEIELDQMPALEQVGAIAMEEYRGRFSMVGPYPYLTELADSAFGFVRNTASEIAIQCRGPALIVGSNPFGGFAGDHSDTAGEDCACSDCTGKCADRCVLLPGKTCASDSTCFSSFANACQTHCCTAGQQSACSFCGSGDGSCYTPLALAPTWNSTTDLTDGWEPTMYNGDRYTLAGPPLDFATTSFTNARGIPNMIQWRLMWSTNATNTDEFTSRTPPSTGLVSGNQGFDPGFFDINATTGKIEAAPRRNGNYTLFLIAEDGAGEAAAARGLPIQADQVIVKRWDFIVVDKPEFRVDKWDWNATGIASIQETDYVHQSLREFYVGDWQKPKIYGVGGTYQFPKISVSESNNMEGDGEITFTMEGAPDGFLIDPTTGYIKGTPTEVPDAKNPMHIYAVNGVGKRAADPLQTIHFDIRKGPGDKPCKNEGAIVDDGFGISFTCDCTDTGFEDANCETDVEVAKSVAASEQSNQTTKLIGGIAGGVIISILLIISAVKYQQHCIAMQPVDFDTQFALMVSMGLIEPEQAKKVRMKPREIRRKDLTLVKVIGSGAFGEVYKAQLDELFTRSTPEYTVAAKTVLDAKSSPEASNEMLAEAGVMAAVGSHPNLVSLIGVITRGDPLVLILQFCAQGELLGMLKKAAAEGEPIALMDKMQMAREVAQGMSHLSKEHFIHRDLACRNVLYADGMCKIADFGLSRGGGGESTTAENEDAATHEDYYKSTAGVFPVRWTAPEAMETLRFTTASDVWSFGIVVIELLVDGETPYHGMSNPDVMKLTMSGGRHGKPPLCSNKLYAVLLKCWDVDTGKRPGFSLLCDAFKEMYTVSSKSADANAARVEAATNDKLKRDEAANQYSSFDDASGGDSGVALALPSVGRADSRVVHNPLFDVDAFIESVANAPTSNSLHSAPRPAVDGATREGHAGGR
jgi:serine/threonine protein kinase